MEVVEVHPSRLLMEHQNQEMEEVVAVDQQRLEKVGVVEQQNQEMEEEVVAAEGQRNPEKAEVVVEAVEQQN